MVDFSNILDAREKRSVERSRAKLERFNGGHGGYSNAMYGSIKNRALDGQIIGFNIPFEYKNELIMFLPGSFGDLETHAVAFCIDHELSTEVASTNNGLQLMVDDDAIQFRLDLEKAANGYVIAHMCEIGNREAMSVGCDILESRYRTIAGHSVKVVSRARLNEISICKLGAAGDNAFASLVDTSLTSKPVAGSRSANYTAYHKLFKISRKIAAMKHDSEVAYLRASIAAYTDQAPIARPITADQSNRLETERIEQMQSERRAMLRRM
jgi:HK97 family phage prohead protease